jgi:hypothetical protein
MGRIENTMNASNTAFAAIADTLSTKLDGAALKAAFKAARKVERTAIKAVHAVEASVPVTMLPCLNVSDTERAMVANKTSLRAPIEGYPDMQMAAFPVGTWALSLDSYFGELAIARKATFYPWLSNEGGVITLSNDLVEGWLFEDGTWMTNMEGAQRLTILR